MDGKFFSNDFWRITTLKGGVRPCFNPYSEWVPERWCHTFLFFNPIHAIFLDTLIWCPLVFSLSSLPYGSTLHPPRHVAKSIIGVCRVPCLLFHWPRELRKSQPSTELPSLILPLPCKELLSLKIPSLSRGLTTFADIWVDDLKGWYYSNKMVHVKIDSIW